MTAEQLLYFGAALFVVVVLAGRAVAPTPEPAPEPSIDAERDGVEHP